MSTASFPQPSVAISFHAIGLAPISKFTLTSKRAHTLITIWEIDGWVNLWLALCVFRAADPDTKLGLHYISNKQTHSGSAIWRLRLSLFLEQNFRFKDLFAGSILNLVIR